ncbi:MAG: O-antigen ligase family protein [Atribacterota bacterium]|nr:O-antigen ligase family protein [Atribacterota bacterium]
MSNKISIIEFLNKAIIFFFCIFCFFLPISNAVIEISLGFILILFLVEFAIKMPNVNLVKIFLLDRLSLFTVAFVILSGLSVLVSGEYFSKSFNSWYSKWVEGIALFYFSYFIFRKKRYIIPLKFLLFSAFMVSINGIFQKINGVGFIRNHSPINVACYNFTAICSTFNHYNSFASFLVVVFFINFGFCLESIRRHKKFAIKDVFYYLNILLIVSCIVMTYSRGGWVSFMFGLTIMLAMLFLSLKDKKYFVYGCIFSVLFLFLLFIATPLRERLLFIFQGGDAARLERWRIAFSIFKSSPWLGKGIGTFLEHFPKNTTIGLQYAHNSYLQLLVEVGILGLAPFLLMLIQWLKNSLHFLKSHENFIFIGVFCGLCAFLAHSFFDNQLFSLRLASLFWFLLGLSSSFIHNKQACVD